MTPITMYTTPYCGFCIHAKRLLDKKSIPYKDIDVSGDRELRRQVSQQTGHRTVPMIFIHDTFIGGCNELYHLDSQGKLDDLEPFKAAS